MEPQKKRYVWVRQQWNSRDAAKVDFESLQNVRWDTVGGGMRAPAPEPFLHGYIQRDERIDGWLASSGVHGDCPHEIKVCIVRQDNDPHVFAELVRIAGPKPARQSRGLERCQTSGTSPTTT